MSDRLGTMHFEPNAEGRSKLKRIVFGAMILVAVLFLLPSTFTYINPGHVGIVIHRAGGGEGGDQHDQIGRATWPDAR
jgi:hypothetical protein